MLSRSPPPLKKKKRRIEPWGRVPTGWPAGAQLLGKGDQGEGVYFFQDPVHGATAVKVGARSRELSFLLKCKGANVLAVLNSWHNGEDLHIQTPLAECDLGSRGKLTPEQGVALLKDGLQALAGCQADDKAVYHLDIKPANILWMGGRWVLCDFGMATDLEQGDEGDCTTMAPELLVHGSLCTKADVFSLGLTVWAAVTGQPLPPNGPEWHRLRGGQVDTSVLGPALAEPVAAMLKPDPEARSDVHELLQVFK